MTLLELDKPSDCDAIDADFGPAPPHRASTQNRRFRLYLFLLAIDSVCIVGSFFIAGFLRYNLQFGSNGLHLAGMVAPIYIFLALNSDAYSYSVLLDWKRGILKAMGSFALSISAILFVAFYSRSSLEFSRLVYGAGSALAAFWLVVGRFGFDRLVKRTLGVHLRSELIIVDNCRPVAAGRARVIEAAQYGLRPNLRDPHMLDRLGKAVDGTDFVLVCCRIEDRAAWSLLLKGTNVQGHVLAPEFDDVGANQLSRYNGHCVMQVASGPLDLRSRAAKRVVDLAITIPAIVALSPLLFVVAVLIKLETPGPVFFKQQRMGRGNRLFNVVKFRSMRIDQCDSDGRESTAKGDARITSVGRFIRATSIDELPQLFNVLNSDMSLVGPRPHALGSMAGFEHFWDVDHRYWHRHSLKPGITGLAQVRGLRGATHKREDLVRRLQADLEYLNNWSIWRDFAILASTIRVVIHPNAF